LKSWCKNKVFSEMNGTNIYILGRESLPRLLMTIVRGSGAISIPQLKNSMSQESSLYISKPDFDQIVDDLIKQGTIQIVGKYVLLKG
jgi:hypothetical protein